MIGHHNHTATSNEATDARTIHKAQQGDTAAFESIYRVHSRRVYSLCWHMTKNPTEAEDLTQDVFLRVFRKIQMFRGESAFSTWLHRLAINVVLMHLRKEKSRTASLGETKRLEEGIATASEVGGLDASLTGLADRVNLKRAVEQLPTAHKIVFVLHDIQGYGHQEIAIGASKGHLHRARRRLRDLLREFVGSLPPVGSRNSLSRA